MFPIKVRQIAGVAFFPLALGVASAYAGQVGPKNCDRGPGIDSGPKCKQRR